MGSDILRKRRQLWLIGTDKYGTKGTAELLSEVGCGAIQEIVEIEDDGKCYEVFVVDEAGQEFVFTMSYDGYPGYITDGDGNYLYIPLDD